METGSVRSRRSLLGDEDDAIPVDFGMWDHRAVGVEHRLVDDLADGRVPDRAGREAQTRSDGDH
jgi:hypothetical protein